MKTMLEVGDYVRHLPTGTCGQIVAYDHQIVDSVYLPTLTVEVVNDTIDNSKTFLEDLSSAWVLVEQQETSNPVNEQN